MKPLNFAFTLLILLFLSCETPSITPQNTDSGTTSLNLISSEYYYRFSSAILKLIAQKNTNQPLPYSFVDVRAIELLYRTTYFNGEEVIASGVILLPETKEAIHLLSFQHAALKYGSKVPSQSILGVNDLTYAAIIASTGVGVILPDYIGYGNSSSFWHPFEHKTTLAQSSLDMLSASKTYLNEKKINTTSNIYLAGYAEGGTATLALHRLLEEEKTESLKKTLVGNGPYAKRLWAKEIVTKMNASDELGYFIKMLLSYNKIYPTLHRPESAYFKSMFLDSLSNLDFSNALSFTSFQSNEIFNPLFTKGIVEETDTVFLEILEKNQISGWPSKTPILFYGSTKERLFHFDHIGKVIDRIKKKGGKVQSKTLQESALKNSLLPFVYEILKEIHFE